MGSWVGSTTNIPVGCSIRNGGDLRPHWNTASTGRGRSDLRPICKAGKKAHKPKKTRMAKMEMKFRRMTKEQFEKKKATIIEKMAKLMNIDASRLELKLTKPFVPSACKDNDSEVNRACDLNPQTCRVWKGEKIRTCSAAVAMARSRNVSCDLKMPTNVKLHEACCKSCSSPGQEEQLTELIDVSARNGYDSSIEAVIKDATPEEEAKAKEVLKGSDLNRELSQEDLNYEGGKLLSIVPESGAAALGVSLTAAFLIALVLIMK